MTRTGSCLCGGVTFELTGELRGVIHCHCGQCRKTSGHYWAATRAKDEQIKFIRDETLTWFKSSDFAERGFCNRCGSSLFYRANGEEGPAIAAGCIEGATDLPSLRHIYVKDKGDYYEIADGLEQR